MPPARTRKLFALAAGVLLAGIPALAFYQWSARYIEYQGRAQAEGAAKQVMALVENHLGRVIGALDGLGGENSAPCSREHLDAMRGAAFATAPIKDLAVLGRDGRTLCTSLGVAIGPPQVFSAAVATAFTNLVLDVVDFGGERMVRIRRIVPDEPVSIAALIPADLLLPRIMLAGLPFATHARIAIDDGILVAESGTAVAEGASPDDRLTVRHRSAAYALEVTASLSRDRLFASYVEFRLLGLLGSGCLLGLGFGAFAYRRQRTNPVAEIERALAANQFVPYYQPVLDITNGRVIGAEVLMRWRKPDGSIVQPVNFVPLAESSGLIFDLTRSLMVQACRDVGAAVGQRPRFKISFNLTARHFTDDSTVADIRAIFGPSPIALSQVVLEVTERQPLGNLNTARRVIASLQELGVQVAIDDVGTGHGGLSYLLKLGVDVLKIDKLFVDSIGAERHSAIIIRSLVELARSMRMDIVAEGVETFDQVAYLREHGIRYAQGYVFAPPLPAQAFLQLLDVTDPLRGADSDPARDEQQMAIPMVASHQVAAA